MTFSFSYLEPACSSMSSSNCCFLTSIQISQEAGQVVWYSHLFQNFPQFIVIHTVKGFADQGGSLVQAGRPREDNAASTRTSVCAQSLSHTYPTLCDPMDCSPPGSSVHGILQARIQECVAISFSRESSQPRDRTHTSCVSFIAGGFFYPLSDWGSSLSQNPPAPTFNRSYHKSLRDKEAIGREKQKPNGTSWNQYGDILDLQHSGFIR